MKKICLIILCIILSSCCCSRQVKLETCTLASEEDGWHRIEKPVGIDKSEHWASHRYFLWYKNDAGQVMLCERDARDQCFQEITNYEFVHGEWVSMPGGKIECLY